MITVLRKCMRYITKVPCTTDMYVVHDTVSFLNRVA
mgnify:CR=1 FL=1